MQLSFDEANDMMVKDPAKFKELVQESLRLHIGYINTLSKRGMRFWDYGNSFLLEASRAKADVLKPGTEGSKAPVFRYVGLVLDRLRQWLPTCTAVLSARGCGLATTQVPFVRGGHHGRDLLPRLWPLPLGVLLRQGRGLACH